jgi:hypothetical protein
MTQKSCWARVSGFGTRNILMSKIESAKSQKQATWLRLPGHFSVCPHRRGFDHDDATKLWMTRSDVTMTRLRPVEICQIPTSLAAASRRSTRINHDTRMIASGRTRVLIAHGAAAIHKARGQGSGKRSSPSEMLLKPRCPNSAGGVL